MERWCTSRKTITIAILSEGLRIACLCHRHEAHAVWRRHGKTPEVLRLPNRADENEDFASDPRARESGFEAFRELRLAHAGKTRHVDRDARLQPNRDQLNELSKFHVSVVECSFLSFAKNPIGAFCVETFLRDVALFLPFRCTKERQTAASAGTKRRSKIAGFYE